MENYEHHIKKNIKNSQESICGKSLISLSFYFENIDHAYFTVKEEGRVIPCQKCVKEILKTFSEL